jgi:hypothetical protein
MRAPEKLEGGHAVLSVNNYELLIRLLQPTHARAVAPGLKTQFLRREQQHRAWDGRLRDGRLIKIPDGATFARDNSRWNALSFRSILAMNWATSSFSSTLSGAICPPSSSWNRLMKRTRSSKCPDGYEAK